MCFNATASEHSHRDVHIESIKIGSVDRYAFSAAVLQNKSQSEKVPCFGSELWVDTTVTTPFLATYMY